MALNKIHFFTEDVTFTPKKKLLLREWIGKTISAENFVLRELNFIFCSDEYLLSINREYLNHDTYTDIITFDNSEKQRVILGDIFISIDRICENASKFAVEETDELHRVMIHGTLHLLGYPDKGKEAKDIMTYKENFYLSERSF